MYKENFIKYISKWNLDKIAKLIKQNPELFSDFVHEETEISPKFAAVATPETPQAAPRLWKDRPPGRQTNPADFIREHYAPWIGNGLARADIKRLDPQLYRAYAKWISRNPSDAVKLPTRSELVSHALESVQLGHQDLARLAAVARMRDIRSRT